MDSKNFKWPKDWKDHPDLVKTAEQMAIANALDLVVPGSRTSAERRMEAWEILHVRGICDKSKAEIASRSKIEIPQQDLYHLPGSAEIAILSQDCYAAECGTRMHIMFLCMSWERMRSCSGKAATN